MAKQKYKYAEVYKGKRIFIYGTGREWWWKVELSNRLRSSPTSYYSIESAINNAREYIEKELI